jgi:ankyrin repeat protein
MNLALGLKPSSVKDKLDASQKARSFSAMEPLVGRIRRRVHVPTLYAALALSAVLIIQGCAAPRDKPDTRKADTYSEQPACDSALMNAAAFGKTEVVDSLLKNGADVNAKDANGWTPLHHAACSAINTETCALLIDSGADVNATNADGNTPLILAAFDNKYYCKTVELLLERGADPNKHGNVKLLNLREQTPLMLAAMSGNAEMAVLLLRHGAKINAMDEYGITALMRAIIEDQNEVAALLVRNKAYVNARDINGWTPLMFAAREGQYGIVSLLLEKGADVNARDQAGRNALTYAMENGHSKTADLLRSAASAR